MNEDGEKLVKTGMEMGARMLMIALLDRAQDAPNRSLDFMEMQYLFQETLKKIETMPPNLSN